MPPSTSPDGDGSRIYRSEVPDKKRVQDEWIPGIDGPRDADDSIGE